MSMTSSAGRAIKKCTSVKTFALGGAALAALCVPALASNYQMPLRGAWNSALAVPTTRVVQPQSYYQSHHSGAMGCASYDPCGFVAQGHPQLQNALRDSAGAYADSGVVAYQGGYEATYAPQQLTEHRVQTAPAGFFSGLRGRKSANYDATAASAQHYDVGGMSVRTNAAHTNRMLDWQENTTGKAVTLLQHRKTGVLAPDSLYIGGAVKGGFMFQNTELPGQFPILSRFPFFSERTDTQAGVFAINNAALALTATFGDWTTIYLQPEYSETDFPGDQDEMQLRKAFVTFGNFDRSPFYAAFGRKTIDFGNFDGYNPFTQTEAQHYFWASSDQPVLELGYYKNGLKASASAFSGGRQLRTAYADENNNIANYAASLEKEFLIGNGAFTLGTSYLHDTIYRNNWTAHTFREIAVGTPPANFIEYRNSAASAFAEYNHPKFDMMVEYTSTFEPWAAAIPQDINGNVNPAYLDANGAIDFDEKLSVLVAQARVKPILFGKETPISLVTSFGNIGDSDYVGTNAFGQPVTFGENQQHVLGIERKINENLDFGAEYVFNKGFIPFVAPQQVSNQDTEAHAINIGFHARF